MMWGKDRRRASQSRANRGSARPGCCPSCGGRPRSAATWCSRARPRSSSAIFRSGSGSTPSTPMSPPRTSMRARTSMPSFSTTWPACCRRSTATSATTAGGLVDERHRAHRAVRALLDLIATAKPLVLVLDDLHWSDAASIELLAALLRRRTAGRVLLALGYRSGKAPPRLGAALAAPAVTIIDLGPLSEAECSTLAGEHLDATQRAAIYSQSGGNPFYTLQLAHASELPSRSSTGDRLALNAGVPRTVAAALLEELKTLTANTRLLLTSASIRGRSVRPRARLRDRRIVTGYRSHGARRAARRAAASPHRRAAPVPVPASARAPRRA